MARRDKTRDERLSIHTSRPINMEAFEKLVKLLCEHMQVEIFEPSLGINDLQRCERAHYVARRYSVSLTIWAEFQAKGLPDSEHDHNEYVDYFNDKNAEIKLHAEALLVLLKNNHLPPAMSAAIGETIQGFLHPDGHANFRTLESSLAARLSQLIAAIEIPTESQERPNKVKGKKAARAESIRAVVHMWLEVGGSTKIFQRDGSDGPPCGSFAEFSKRVLGIFGIKHSGLEEFIKEGEVLIDDMSESQLKRLRNQFSAMNQ